MKNFLYNLLNGAIRASTKVTFIFFAAVTATIGGGAYTIFSGNGGAPEPEMYVEDMRVPASFQGGQGSLPNLLAGTGRGTVYPSQQGMPANYDERERNQGQGGGEGAEPVSVTPDGSAAMAEGAAQRAAAEQAQGLRENGAGTDTNTSTSTSTGTDVSNFSPNGGTGTGTSTSTSTSSTTSSGPRYLYLTSDSSGIPGYCMPVTLSFYDSSLVAAALGSDTQIAMTATAGALFTDIACSAAAGTSVTVRAGASAGTFYFKYEGTGSVTLTAEHTSYNTSTVSITLAHPAGELVLGQPNFTASTNNNGGLSASTLYAPFQSARTGSKLVVADSENHRVLIWTSVPTTDQQAADLVLGQPNLTSNAQNNGGIGANTLFYPDYVATDGTRLLVADRGNNRVLIWTSFPTSTQQAADLVLGQANFTANGANQGGIGANTLSGPECALTDGTRVVVCDTVNNRVLVWTSFPTADGQAADLVLGQADMTSSGNTAGPSSLDQPFGAAISSSGGLLVSDLNNHRVLVWGALPTSNGQAADYALGQPDTTANTDNNGGLSAASLSSPATLSIDSSGRLFVTDFGNNRILVYNSVPTQSGASADSVFGQEGSFTVNTANNGGIGAGTLFEPWGVHAYEGELWIADQGNHRLLQFSVP